MTLFLRGGGLAIVYVSAAFKLTLHMYILTIPIVTTKTKSIPKLMSAPNDSSGFNEKDSNVPNRNSKTSIPKCQMSCHHKYVL